MTVPPCQQCGRAHTMARSCGACGALAAWTAGSPEERRIADLAERIAVDRFLRHRADG
jgi:primosomal protein N'